MARQKGVKKRGLHVVNEHFEHLFNAASAALGINHSFLMEMRDWVEGWNTQTLSDTG